MWEYKHEDSHFFKIGLNSVTTYNIALNTSQFIPSHTLLAWIHTMPHQQRSPQIIRTQWGQCDFSPGLSSGTPTEKLLKLSSYVHIMQCLNNMANTSSYITEFPYPVGIAAKTSFQSYT